MKLSIQSFKRANNTFYPLITDVLNKEVKMVDEGDSDKLEQPDIFDLELDLVRWVKQAIAEPSPPLMAKPAGNVTQFYGLDSKSR